MFPSKKGLEKIKDGGSPAARLRFARLTLARLGLNDGAKLSMGVT